MRYTVGRSPISVTENTLTAIQKFVVKTKNSWFIPKWLALKILDENHELDLCYDPNNMAVRIFCITIQEGEQEIHTIEHEAKHTRI